MSWGDGARLRLARENGRTSMRRMRQAGSGGLLRAYRVHARNELSAGVGPPTAPTSSPCPTRHVGLRGKRIEVRRHKQEAMGQAEDGRRLRQSQSMTARIYLAPMKLLHSANNLRNA